MFFIWSKIFVYSILSIFLLGRSSEHPIYLSSTEVQYNSKNKSLEISVKIFADDLELVFEDKYKEKIELGTEREHPKAKEYIVTYIQNHLKFYTDNKLQTYKYLGHESGGKSDMFAMYVYLEAEQVKPFKILKVKNSILIDDYKNQLNFISCHTKNHGLKKVINRKGNLTKEIKW